MNVVDDSQAAILARHGKITDMAHLQGVDTYKMVM